MMNSGDNAVTPGEASATSQTAWWRMLGVFVALALLGLPVYLLAQPGNGTAPPQGEADDAEAQVAIEKPITIKMVTDFETGQLVSELEAFEPITQTTFRASGSRTVTLGERTTLWVRNAHVSGQYFFERYYQGKYIGRDATLTADAAKLGTGEHFIEPGHHRFVIHDDGSLSSDDPDIKVEGDTLMLRLHPVTVYGVDAAKQGPPQLRQVPTNTGVFALEPDYQLDSEALPNPRQSRDPRKAASAKNPDKLPQITTMISHQRDFYPLTVWLPANTQGQGYALYPSWQTFHLASDGSVTLGARDGTSVPGVTAQPASGDDAGPAIINAYRSFEGQVNTRRGMSAGVGNNKLEEEMTIGPTLEKLVFRAGAGESPAEGFGLPVNNDFEQLPNKLFLADNTTNEPKAIRLVVLEWDEPVFTAGAEAQMSLRLLESEGYDTVKSPRVRMSYSSYDPSLPNSRVWRDMEVIEWQNDRDRGPLRFRMPDIEPGFVAIRAQIIDADNVSADVPLTAEVRGAVVKPGQFGSVSVVASKGRSAFVAGEDVNLEVVFRSSKPRPAGQRTLVLTTADGRTERLTIDDPGDAWFTAPVELVGDRTINLLPGKCTLTVEGLPDGVAAQPFTFDLVGRQKPSLYHVVKPSKYTDPMNRLERSHWQGEPVDLDRAIETIANLGYNRVDLMTYVTNHHLRAYTWREELAAGDPRLPSAGSVFTPSPRDQILNAATREQLQFADVWLSYNDFHLPRYIDPYISASERWLAREVQAQRHNPAWDGIMIYEEMYQAAVSGLVPWHQKMFSRIRGDLITEAVGQTPSQIEQAFDRYTSMPRAQRDPKALENYLAMRWHQQHGWADFVNRVVGVSRPLAPEARFGTFYRTFASPGNNDTAMHGYPPDLFKNLDLISHVHYADNSTAWVSIPALSRILRTSHDKTLYINLPITHESRTRRDGQYQRHMAFALMAQGANGISQWGQPASFDDMANPQTAKAYETTRHLNETILQPFGEVIDRTTDGYHNVGIISTFNQLTLDKLAANMTEGIWIACWRMGYNAHFVRESDLTAEKLSEYDVLFAPAVRYDGTFTGEQLDAMRQAIANGTRIVTEKGSVLDLPGVTHLQDWTPNSFYTGEYFATWHDDELNKVYSKSQPIVDYLQPKLKEWNVEPAAVGPFKVGPGWRDGGAINYLIMANFDDPEYRHTVKQQMAKPIVMPLQIPAHRGNVAYDLMAKKRLDVTPVADKPDWLNVTLDMTRLQGSLVAMLPEPVDGVRVNAAQPLDFGSVRVTASLIGESGQPIEGVFPVRIELTTGDHTRTFYRTIGRDIAAVFDLPHTADGAAHKLVVHELISGKTVATQINGGKPAGPAVVKADHTDPIVPHADDIRRFMADPRPVTIVASPVIEGAGAIAQSLADQLRSRGWEPRILSETQAYRVPKPDKDSEDPKGDGFHTWRGNQEVIAPGVIVDQPVILLGGKGSLYLLDTLEDHGYFTHSPFGGPNRAVRPSVQLAARALHFSYDTLCLIANDADGLRHAMETALADLPEPSSQPVAEYGSPRTATSGSTDKAAAPTPAVAFAGTNEMVDDMEVDADGNIYVATWGHGKNLYSFTPEGELRFARHLPEMGAYRLDLFDDRLLVYTAAGARLYQLTLEGKPISQARIDMDPGPVGYRDEYGLSYAAFEYLPRQDKLVHKTRKDMRVIDNETFTIEAAWQGAPFQDKDVSEKVMNRRLFDFAVSPDGKYVAQIEASYYFASDAYKDKTIYDTHLVLRDSEGNLLAEALNLDNGEGIEASIVWPADAPGPVIEVNNRRLQFDIQLERIGDTPASAAYSLSGGDRLVRDGRSLQYVTVEGQLLGRFGPLETMPSFVKLSPDGKTVAMLDEYGELHLFAVASGDRQHSLTLPQRGGEMRFSHDGGRLIIGGYRGLVMSVDLANGAVGWQQALEPYNDILDQELPLYDPSFVDKTERLWPVKRDTPGGLEEDVRMGENRLANADAESDGGWQGAVAYEPYGYESSRSLRIGAETVSQTVDKYIGEHATWVLEFFYRAAASRPSGSVEPSARLLAGMMVENDAPDSVGRQFQAGNDWQYGRVVIKSGANPTQLMAGFNATGGEVLVDRVQLRRVRFPSINHLLYEPLYPVKPVILDNPLFANQYDPFGRVRDEAPNKVVVSPVQTGALNLVESAYFQNGRINEMSSSWYIQPKQHAPLITAALREPRWISMVALYFNAYDADNITPHFNIYAVDAEAKEEKLVAEVRHNGQLMRLVTFPPIKTSTIRIEVFHSVARLRTLTEIELYGPLSGKEGTPGFAEAAGQNTWMGDFSRVDKRDKPVPERFHGPQRWRGRHGAGIGWNAPMAQPLVSDGVAYIGRSYGKNSAHPLQDPGEVLYLENASPIGYTPYGMLYGGLILRPGNDGKLYCINPETGTELWSSKLGARMFGCPVALQEDVYTTAIDPNRLYHLDLANGGIMKQLDLPGVPLGGIATDGERLYLTTDNGKLLAYDMASFTLAWQMDIAPYTDSTPAVDHGVVYLADQQGIARAVDAASGKEIWRQQLGDEFMRCPVVGEKYIAFGCRGGTLAVLHRDSGAMAWSKQVNSRFYYEPMMLTDKAKQDTLVYLQGNTVVLADTATGSEREFVVPKTHRGKPTGETETWSPGEPGVPLAYYDGSLVVVPMTDHKGYRINFQWHVVGGEFWVANPVKPEPAEEASAGKEGK